MDPFRENLSLKAKLIDDLDALNSWAERMGFVADEGGDPEFMDILEHLADDIKDLI
jgi:hypothetical protein